MVFGNFPGISFPTLPMPTPTSPVIPPQPNIPNPTFPSQSVIDGLRAQISVLQTEKLNLVATRTELEASVENLKSLNSKLLVEVNLLRQQSTTNEQDRETVDKVLKLVVQATQDADAANSAAVQAKADAAVLLRQAVTAAGKALETAPGSNEAKAADTARGKAASANADVLKNVPVVQTTSQKIKDLSNNFITGKSKIDNKSEARIKKEKTQLAKDMKALTDAMTILRNEANEASRHANASAGSKPPVAVTPPIAAQAGGGENWNVIGPLFGFGVSTTQANNSVDNWDTIQKLFGFSTPATPATPDSATPDTGTTSPASTKSGKRPVGQFQERFRAVNDISASLGFGAAFPNFNQAGHGKGVVYGTIFIKSDFVQSRDIPARELENPTDDSARFRAVNNWAAKNGFATGFPNFHQTGQGQELKYGTQLLKIESAEWRDIPAKDLGNPADDQARFKAVQDWAVKNGFVGGFPNFHKADYGQGIVYGTWLFKQGVAELRDVPASDLAKI